jgi:hypothetical protein
MDQPAGPSADVFIRSITTNGNRYDSCKQGDFKRLQILLTPAAERLRDVRGHPAAFRLRASTPVIFIPTIDDLARMPYTNDMDVLYVFCSLRERLMP